MYQPLQLVSQKWWPWLKNMQQCTREGIKSGFSHHYFWNSRRISIPWLSIVSSARPAGPVLGPQFSFHGHGENSNKSFARLVLGFQPHFCLSSWGTNSQLNLYRGLPSLCTLICTFIGLNFDRLHSARVFKTTQWGTKISSTAHQD